jgi:hypothetical protein
MKAVRAGNSTSKPVVFRAELRVQSRGRCGVEDCRCGGEWTEQNATPWPQGACTGRRRPPAAGRRTNAQTRANRGGGAKPATIMVFEEFIGFAIFILKKSFTTKKLWRSPTVWSYKTVAGIAAHTCRDYIASHTLQVRSRSCRWRA